MRSRSIVALLIGVFMLAACGNQSSASSKHTPRPTASVSPANVPNDAAPSAQTGSNHANWVGMNYNWTLNFPQAQTDLAAIKSWGISRVRLNIIDWNSSDEIKHWRDITTEALTQGFYVLYGMSQGPDNTPANESLYFSAVQAEARWAQGLKRPSLEMVIGNEAELHPRDESKAPRDFIRRLAAAAKAIYTYGKVSYDTSAYDWAINGWLTDPEGLGSLDRLGLNVFYSDDAQFRNAISGLLNKYAGRLYISEWNVDGGFTAQTTEQTFVSKIRSCLQILHDLGVSEAYFYNYQDLNTAPNEGTYGVEMPNGTFNVPVEQLLQQPNAA